MDRIDLHVEVPRVNFQLLSSKTESLSSAQMREQVEFALQLQKRRYAISPSLSIVSCKGNSFVPAAN